MTGRYVTEAAATATATCIIKASPLSTPHTTSTYSTHGLSLVWQAGVGHMHTYIAPFGCRWHNQLNPVVRKDPFTELEDAVIVKVGVAPGSGCGGGGGSDGRYIAKGVAML